MFMKRRLISILLAASMVLANTEGVFAASEDELFISDLEEEDSFSEDEEEAQIELTEGSEDEFFEDTKEQEIILEEPEDDLSEEIEIVQEEEEEPVESTSYFPDNTEGKGEDHPKGYRELDHKMDIKSLENEDLAGLSLMSEEDISVEYYVTPNLPPLRSQGDYGTCWAFSALSLAEIGMMNNGELPYYYSPEYSKLHLAYFSYRSVEDPLGGTAGDRNSCNESGISMLNLGGNVFLAENVLANWTGAASEEILPYEMAGSLNESIIDEGLAYDDMAHLQSYYDQEYNTENLLPIKNLIKKCGAVSISFYAVNPFCGGSDATVYNSEYNSYYNPDFNFANHAVSIVGWDDNFPKEHFSRTAPADGAWLVRNSWKEGDLEDSCEYDGYFWMSYYEGSLYDYVHAFEFESSESYDNNYQYDGGMDVNTTYARKAANVFTSKAPGGADGETLKAVGFYSGYADADYEISIYTDLNDSGTDPEDGYLLSRTSGRIAYAGFNTIKLEEPVVLLPDTVFSVVVELKDKPVEGEEDIYRRGAFGYECEACSWYTVETAAMEGQSFIKPSYDADWEDFGALNNCNIKIKAYTTDNTEMSGEVIAPTEISFDKSMQGLMLGVCESRKILSRVSPATATNKKLEYISSDESVVTVVNGYLYGKGPGDATITARALLPDENGSFAQNSFDITVETRLLGMTIAGADELEMGNEYTFELKAIPKEASLPEEPTWISSDPKIVSIDCESGVARAKEVGCSLITAVCGEESENFYVWVYPQAPVGLKARVDRMNTVTIMWEASAGARSYEILRDGQLVKRIASAQGKTEYSFVDHTYKEDYDSREISYTVRSIRKPAWISDSISVSTYEKIDLDPDGGVCDKAFAVCMPGEEPENLPVPVKKGYSFQTWERISDNEMIARYLPNTYTVSFDKGVEDATGTMESISCEYGKEEYLPANIFVREGNYDFAGWNTRADGSGKSYSNMALIRNLTAKSAGEVRLYAQWEEAKRTVCFDTMGGSYMPSVRVPAGELMEEPVRIPVKSKCVFGGWYKTPELTEPCAFPVRVTEDMTLYAKWTGEPQKIEITNESGDTGNGNILFTGSKEGREGYSLELSAKIILTDGMAADDSEIIWTTSDPLVAGFLTEEGKRPVSRTNTEALSGNSVTVAIYSEDTDLDGYQDSWPNSGSYAYIYATSASDDAVYGSVRVTVIDPDSGDIYQGDETDMIIMHEDVRLSAGLSGGGEVLSMISGQEAAVSPVFLPEAPANTAMYYSSDNIAVASVSNSGVVTARSAGTTTITAKNLGTGLSACFRVQVNEEITELILSDRNIKVGEGNTFEIGVSALIPATGSGDVTFESSNGAVAELLETRIGDSGRPVGIFLARGSGKAVITALAGKGSAKCVVTVGTAVSSITIKTGKGILAVDKTVKLTAVLNDGVKKQKPVNKQLTWTVTDLDGTATDKAYINPKNGKLTALKPGCVKVRAESTTDGVMSADDDSCVIKIYAPIKKATLSAKEISVKPGREYRLSLNLTSASVAGYPVTGGFDEDGEAVDILDKLGNISFSMPENDYAEIENLHHGECRIIAGPLESKGSITLKVSYQPFGASKVKTLSCKVKVTNNAVSKIALSSSKITLGRGAEASVSARLTPTAPEEAGVVWTIPSDYAEDICFVEDGEEKEDTQITTSLYEGSGNTVKIRAKENASVKNKTVKLLAETVAVNKKGLPYKASCNVVLYGNANCIEFSGLENTLAPGKSFTAKAVSYFVSGDEKIKSGIQQFTFTSSDISVATVNRTSGKVTAVGAGTATITATAGDGSGLSANFSVRVYEPVSILRIDKASFYMGLKNKEAKSAAAAKESALAAYNVLTPVVLPEGTSDEPCEFTWTIDNVEAMETAALDAASYSGASGVTEVQRTLAALDNGSYFAKNDKIVTTSGQGLALKAVAVGMVNITVTSSNGKKASCKIKVNAHVNGINVITEYGATPDDGKADNAAFNEAIEKAHANYKSRSGYTVVFVPGGTYDIEPFNTCDGSDRLTTGIHMLKGVTLYMDSDAILKVRGTSWNEYGVICVEGEKEDYGRGEVVPDNVVITGGQIYGERTRHTGEYGEGGHGIYLAGACNVTISDMLIRDNWGDGIYVGTRALFAESVGCRNITVKNCDLYNNRRNGISIVDIGTDSDYKKGLFVENCVIRDCNGTAPQCGIYVEPNNKPKTSGYLPSEFTICDTIKVKDTDITALNGRDDPAYTCFMTHYDPGNSAYVTARDITFDHCKIKGYFGNYSGQNLKLIDTSIIGTKILGSNR